MQCFFGTFNESFHRLLTSHCFWWAVSDNSNKCSPHVIFFSRLSRFSLFSLVFSIWLCYPYTWFSSYLFSLGFVDFLESGNSCFSPVFSHYFFKLCFIPFSFSSLGTLITYMCKLLILSHRSLRVCSLFSTIFLPFLFFSFLFLRICPKAMSKCGRVTLKKVLLINFCWSPDMFLCHLHSAIKSIRWIFVRLSVFFVSSKYYTFVSCSTFSFFCFG